jgi:hypothetical protein
VEGVGGEKEQGAPTMSLGEAVFTTCYRRVKLPTLQTPWNLWPIGDVHHDSVNCDRRRFGAAMSVIKRNMTPYDLVLYMGDENDKVAASEGAALRMTNLHGGTAEKFDKDAIRDAKEFLDVVAWSAPYTLGMIEGNHTWRFLTSGRGHTQGETTTVWLARRMKTRWLGYLSYIRIGVECGNRNQRYSVDIVACHGKAGGKLVGTSINQVDDLRAIFPAADIYIMGDNHQRGAWPVSNLFCSPTGQHGLLAIKQKRQFLCRSGSFLRGFVENTPLYTVRRLLRPAELGHIRIVISYTRRRWSDTNTGGKQRENGELDIKVEA